MMKDDQRHGFGNRWLVFLVAVLLGAAGTLVWSSGTLADGRRDNDRDDRGGFRGRDDHDWDDMDRDHHREAYSIGLWGDLPYSDNQALYGVPNMILDMNSQKLAFTVHDGDLKAGNAIAGSITHTTCANELYSQALGYFNALKAPAVFTTGDNDWTDCDRPANRPVAGETPVIVGNFDSLERLDYERSVFFSGIYATATLGQHQLHQAVQGVTPGVDATPCLGYTHPQVPCVENRRWTIHGVTYATLNIQGSCNNLCDTAPNPAEYAARNLADIAWMRETFQVAKDRNSVAVMFFSQGDPGFDRTDPTRSPLRDPKTLAELDVITSQDGFKDFLIALRTEVENFEKPVAYVHGDSHYFRIDKPFYDDRPADAAPPVPVASLPIPAALLTPTAPAQARRIENFTRVETFGDNTFNTANAANDDNNVHWLKVFVDPDSREVFSYETQIVPGNRVVVPAP